MEFCTNLYANRFADSRPTSDPGFVSIFKTALDKVKGTKKERNRKSVSHTQKLFVCVF